MVGNKCVHNLNLETPWKVATWKTKAMGG